jgi:cytochrome P450
LPDTVLIVLRLVALAVLAGVAWPALRMAASTAFRNRLGAHPGLPHLILAAIVGYAGVVLALAMAPLPLLAVAAAAALVVAGLAHWRARPDFGRRRGLPPGSLAATSLAMVEDHRHLLDQARLHGPVFKIGRFGQKIVCVQGLERCNALLRRHGDDLVSGGLPFDRLIPGGFIRYMPPDRHARYRRLLAGALTPELVRAGRPLMAEEAALALAAMAGQSTATGIDPAPHLLRYTTRSMLRLFLGLGRDDPMLGKALALYPVIASANLSRRTRKRVSAALATLNGLFAEAIRRSASGSSPSLAAGLVAARTDAPDDPTLLGNLVYMIETGGRDTADLLLWVLKELADHPDQAAELGRTADPGLARRIVLETLRREQSEYVVRRVMRPITVEGYTVPAGWLLRFCVRESHRDPAVFADPERFDPDRFLGDPPRANAYAPFGLGVHTCLGRSLVLALATDFLTPLGGGHDWRVTADGPRVFGSFHWMPSRRFRLAFSSRAA